MVALGSLGQLYTEFTGCPLAAWMGAEFLVGQQLRWLSALGSNFLLAVEHPNLIPCLPPAPGSWQLPTIQNQILFCLNYLIS